MTRFVLDSGDPQEYKDIISLAEKYGSEIWGSTTNPSLIARKLSEQGKKLTPDEAFALQKDLVLEILELVPGAVSAEVFADAGTTGEEMIEQGREIATWHERVVVKLPTTLEGFKARTELRKDGITTNNTLVFSAEQIFAISFHEVLLQKEYGSLKNPWPPFISPFVGRLDDIGEDGMRLVYDGMEIKTALNAPVWMLEASVRSNEHIEKGIALDTELITAPAKVYQNYFTNPQEQSGEVSYTDPWQPNEKQLAVTLDTFQEALEQKTINISHPLTEKGLIKFAQDWQSILS